jgi:hypothetical protein
MCRKRHNATRCCIFFFLFYSIVSHILSLWSCLPCILLHCPTIFSSFLLIYIFCYLIHYYLFGANDVAATVAWKQNSRSWIPFFKVRSCYLIFSPSCLLAFLPSFPFVHIAIEWERFQVRSSNISKFFNFKFSHLHFLWLEKLRVFVLAFVKNKMSSFQMESLKVMEKLDGGNFHLWKFKMRMMLSKHGLWKC